MQVHGVFNRSVGHRFIVWQFEADPGEQRGSEHTQALGGLLHEVEGMPTTPMCAESKVPHPSSPPQCETFVPVRCERRIVSGVMRNAAQDSRGTSWSGSRQLRGRTS